MISRMENIRTVESEANKKADMKKTGNFNFYPKPNPKCLVGSKIHLVLDVKLDDAQKAMKDSLSKTTIADLSKDI